MNKLSSPLITLSLLSALCTPAHAVTTTDDIMLNVWNNHCDLAFEQINPGLSSGKPEIVLLTGSLYERGLCVEQNWEKAAQLYQQAAKSGLMDQAVPRLVAVYAVNYRDPAAALWWAAQRPSMLPKACAPATDPVKDSTAFVDQLRAWPEAQLKACTYYAGVMFRLFDKNRYNIRGRSDEVPVDVRLNLANGTVEWDSPYDNQKVISRVSFQTKEPDESTMPEKFKGDPFLRYLWWSGVATLRDFGAPPPDVPSVDTKVTFQINRALLMPGMMQFISVSPN